MKKYFIQVFINTGLFFITISAAIKCTKEYIITIYSILFPCYKVQKNCDGIKTLINLSIYYKLKKKRNKEDIGYILKEKSLF